MKFVATAKANPSPPISAAGTARLCADRCDKVPSARWLSSGCSETGTPAWGWGTRSPASGAPACSVHRSSFPSGWQSSSSSWWCSDLGPASAVVCPGDLCRSWGHWSSEWVLCSTTCHRSPLVAAVLLDSLNSNMEKTRKSKNTKNEMPSHSNYYHVWCCIHEYRLASYSMALLGFTVFLRFKNTY